MREMRTRRGSAYQNKILEKSSVVRDSNATTLGDRDRFLDGRITNSIKHQNAETVECTLAHRL
jgi:hypothetical protein